MTTEICWNAWTPPSRVTMRSARQGHLFARTRGETDGTAKAMQWCVDAIPTTVDRIGPSISPALFLGLRPADAWGEFGRYVSEGRISGWRKVARATYGRA